MSDLRYDTASLRAYAANLVELFDGLIEGGMTRDEALEVVLEFVRAIRDLNK